MTATLDYWVDAGPVPDPLATLRIGDQAPADADLIEDRRGRQGTSCEERTSGVPSHGYVACDRAFGHPAHWAHVAVRGGIAVAVWSGELPEPDLPDVVDDTGRTVDPLHLTPGDLVHYRNKEGLLAVVGLARRRRGGDPQGRTVEVLDLDRRMFRRIAARNLVPLRDEALGPTPEQTRWVGEFIAERRRLTRAVALRELTNGRWAAATMNDALARLDIEQYEPPRAAEAQVQVRVRLAPGSQLDTRRKVQAALRKAVAELVLDGVELEVTGISGGEPETDLTGPLDPLVGLRF